MGHRQRHNSKPKGKKDRFVLESLAAQAGIDRVAHFAAGRSAREWRPTQTVTKNRRAHSNKRACRGRAQE